MTSRFLVRLAITIVLGTVLAACKDPPPEPGKPVLKIHGTKPPSIDLSLRLRYVATTEQRQCQKFTMRTTGYVPREPAWHVWPHEPPSRKPDRRYRVVPMDTTGSLPDSLKGKNLEPFQWTVNAGWGGKPRGCDFKTKYAELILIHRKKSDDKNEINKVYLSDNIYIKMYEGTCKSKDFNKKLGGTKKVKCGSGFEKK